MTRRAAWWPRLLVRLLRGARWHGVGIENPDTRARVYWVTMARSGRVIVSYVDALLWVRLQLLRPAKEDAV